MPPSQHEKTRRACLLDTNLLVHYVRKDALAQQVENEWGLMTNPSFPLICYVSEGEIRSLARQWGWGKPRLKELDFLLHQFVRLPVEQDGVLEAYVEMDVQSRK